MRELNTLNPLYRVGNLFPGLFRVLICAEILGCREPNTEPRNDIDAIFIFTQASRTKQQT